MNSHWFQHMSCPEKLRYVWTKGRLLSYADWKHGLINLYDCGGKCFVEVYYNIRHNYIEKVIPVKSANDLEKYLSKIRIPQV